MRLYFHPTPLACVECPITFETNDQLRKHGEQMKHHPYGCTCGRNFTRLDALNRHITSEALNAPQFPCEYCYARQGENGFRRRDHLVQHLKHYHKIETADKILHRKPAESEGAFPEAVGTGPQVPAPFTALYSAADTGYFPWGGAGPVGFGAQEPVMNLYDVQYSAPIQQDYVPVPELQVQDIQQYLQNGDMEFPAVFQ
ncbi:hypothetical protein M426DRAFT_220079 [Hypoxylon sp. CI-4A]|nr:hypothetical protein M426DRAFT_220079 [Hypoxylon sp. CI-4A]